MAGPSPFQLVFATQEDPVERLDRLVLQRTIHPTDAGFGMWCYHCKQVVIARPFEPNHEWFESIAWGTGGYNDHVALCYLQTRAAAD